MHKRIVPFFIESDQRFIYGPELKSDLKKIDEYFSQSKSEIEKKNGVFSFAWYPPDNDNFLTTRMWDDLRPHWRLSDNLAKQGVPQNQEIPEDLKNHIKNAYKKIKEQEGEKVSSDFDLEDANDVILKRNVRARRGKWQLFSDNIINSKERLMGNDTEE